ncbi:hypothetical protein TrCOL_g1894 [Triparma columacea]|uniref:Protein kinase domain-containing protein n=1 Tax=Triparma columacea TaxID=722753 RepID=A0A9W7FUV3_9STRA|nr:hypothetical protein TrCOL_g1894 [Triparma columacea]
MTALSSTFKCLLIILILLNVHTHTTNARKTESVLKYFGTVPAVPSVEHTAAYQSREPPRSVNEALNAHLKPSPSKVSKSKASKAPLSILDKLNDKIAKLGINSWTKPRKGSFDVVSGHGREEVGAGSSNEASLKYSAYVAPPSFFQLLFRFLHLTLTFSPVFLSALPAFLSTFIRESIFYPLLVRSLSQAGPAFIKWGQWASTRADMFPLRLCDEMGTLHANAPAHPFKYTKNLVEDALQEGGTCGEEGKSCFDSVFTSFSHSPVASGSIAQVHKATIRPSNPSSPGTEVAIKVRHPMVAELIDRDFRIMRKLGSIIDTLSGGWLSVRSSIEQFSHTMAEQARLDVEGYHLDLLNYNFRGWPRVNFPRTIYATQTIVIESFETGEVVGDLLKGLSSSDNRVSPQLASFIVTLGESLYLKMLLVDNLMHADLHPGNILVDMTGLEEDKFKLTLVDAGMVAQLNEAESMNFIGLLSALGASDADKAAEAVLSFGGVPTKNDEFVVDMRELFKERCRGYGHNVDVGEVLRGVLNLVRKHQIRISANYATLVVNVLCIESMAKKLVPDYNVLDAGKPLLSSYRKLLCYKPKSRTRRLIFKLWMPVAHMIKARNDKRFFKMLHERMGVEWRGEKRRRRRRRLKKFVGGAIAAGLTVSLGIESAMKR